MAPMPTREARQSLSEDVSFASAIFEGCIHLMRHTYIVGIGQLGELVDSVGHCGTGSMAVLRRGRRL